MPNPLSDNAGRDVFTTTHWSVVLEAGRNDSPRATAALERLCCTYWYPIYAFIRRRGFDQNDADPRRPQPG